MSASDIVLVIVSGLGVIHGLFLSIFLWIYTKGNALSNKLLSALLLVLSFRIGKSVFLEFTENLDVKMIFIGLGTIMAVGPLFYLFTKSCINKSFQLDKIYTLQFLPSFLGVCFGIWIEEPHLKTLPMWIFAILFLTYYLHFIVYLIIGFRYVKRHQNELSQDVYKLLMLFFYSLLSIWVVYVFNLFDEIIPYIVGPLLYSLVAYVVSFVVIRKGYIEKIDHTKYKTTPVADEQIEKIYIKAQKMIEADAKFKNPELSLKSLSSDMRVSPQVLSLVINQRSKMNFNSFINSYRVKEAIRLFEKNTYDNHTIAAIAFEIGFNSISSFNTAFKKQTGQTPQTYRKKLIK